MRIVSMYMLFTSLYFSFMYYLNLDISRGLSYALILLIMITHFVLGSPLTLSVHILVRVT